MAKGSLNLPRLAVAVAFSICLALLPEPAGVTAEGWRAFAFFVGFILACLLSVGGIGVLALILIAALLATGAMPIETLLNGFANPAVWLVLFAFFAAIGFRNSKLGYRIAYWLIAKIGNHPISLVYAISACDFIIAPFVPNTNARGAGILYPVTKALAEAVGATTDEETAQTFGAFLFMASFQLNLIIGALFLTAMSTNPLATEFLAANFGVDISWVDWFRYASVPVILALLIVPWVIYALHKPKMTAEEMAAAPRFAQNELAKMGPLQKDEIMMTVIFLGMIILWALGNRLGIHAATTAILGAVALLITQVISYDDIIHEAKAWDILLWLAPLIAITGYLSETGVINWLVESAQAPLVGQIWPVVYVISVLAYFYVHYLLTSLFVHLQAFFLPFVGILVSMGGDPLVIGMIFALLTCMSPGTTHYGTGTASIYFAAGYMSQKAWWKTGFFVSLVEIILVAGLGYFWISLVA